VLNSWTLFAISTGYVALLFAVAYFGDRKARLAGAPSQKPWVYSLALGVYCTSWTFYGAVGRAATSGWDFLPIYLGPVLVFVFWTPLLERIVRISKRHNITSIADFIGARYGRHQPIAMLVTCIAVVGVLPYIALQLKAVAFGFEVLSAHSSDGAVPFLDNALLIAAMLAAFAILFGTREVLSSENHHGMVLAIAFESFVKLGAFLLVGAYAVYVLRGGLLDAYSHAMTLPQVVEPLSDSKWRFGFVAQTILAGAAIFCLPRQFHVTVVESAAPGDVRTARWLFPAYLALISLFVLPIAAAGLEQFAHSNVAADTFVLALPLAGGHRWLAMATYLGGFSAATGMVIVETIALSTMICNELVMPLLLRSGHLRHRRGQDVSALIKSIRRVAIVTLVMLAYLYFRLFTAPGTLTQIGLLSFTAVAQFAPSIIGGVYWKRGQYQGVIAGLATGALVWIYTLLMPELLSSAGPSLLVRDGPFGIGWLRPQALFGFDGLDSIAHGALWSLLLNTLAYVGVSLARATRLHERLQAARFLGDANAQPAAQPNLPHSAATVGDLQELLECFVGRDHARGLCEQYAARLGRTGLLPHERADPEFVRVTEHLLAGALGASSARVVMASMLRGRDMQLEDVVRLLDETSHLIQFNRELLRAALEHLSQGVSVVDAELRLVAWNKRYLDLFEYPPGMVAVGRPIEELMRYNASRGLLHSTDLDEAMRRRLEHMRAGHAYTHERALPGGTALEIQGNPMPGGGFVTTYADVTVHKRTQRDLLESNEMLESRVTDRTEELMKVNRALAEAKSDAERANFSKTRFLAAASHDLAQPITAARLFMSAVQGGSVPATAGALLQKAGNALSTAETLLMGLLDISRLDAGAEEVRLSHFELATLLEPLGAEFQVLARNKGLALRLARCGQVVYSDARLLRRVLQNFLTNAVRYTKHGRILIGCRRSGKTLRIEVWDSGPGIPPEKQVEIFEEFRRIDTPEGTGERGLGLGLAIADRTARLLGHRLSLRSWPGHGSVFAITVPMGDRAAIALPRKIGAHGPDRVAGSVVMCVENEPAVLSAIEALLRDWGCEVVAVRDRISALTCVEDRTVVPDLLLVDYHLDAGVSGIGVAEELQSLWGGEIPSIIITADHTQAAKRAAAVRGYQVLPKPLKPAALRALMNRMLA
jgi:Na+/proline symporter/signal transduction histidine kinase